MPPDWAWKRSDTTSSLIPIPICKKSRARFEEKRLRDFAAELFPGQHVESIVENGDAGNVIHKVAQHQGADLEMLPTYGLGPVRRFLLGSVTAKVLHDISTPV
jgi:nucleotide-binding universal stress UspA family protein